MKKIDLAAAVFAVLAVASCAMAEGGTMGNLAEAGNKISSIDMNKNFSQAGNILDGFYTGTAAKKEAAAPVAAEKKESRTLSQAEKAVCNAKPSKISTAASKVPKLDFSAGSATDKKKSPAAARGGQNKSWSDDLETVIEDGPGYIHAHVEHFADQFNPHHGWFGGAIQG